ncbi:MAG: hypothetical protein AB1599_02445 [Planctomycetota bacterium]
MEKEFLNELFEKMREDGPWFRDDDMPLSVFIRLRGRDKNIPLQVIKERLELSEQDHCKLLTDQLDISRPLLEKLAQILDASFEQVALCAGVSLWLQKERPEFDKLLQPYGLDADKLRQKFMAKIDELDKKESGISLGDLFKKIRLWKGEVQLAAYSQKMADEFAYHFGLSKIRITPDFYAIVQVKDKNIQFIFRNAQDHSPTNEFDGGKLLIGESKYTVTDDSVDVPIKEIPVQDTRTVIVDKNGKEYLLP